MEFGWLKFSDEVLYAPFILKCPFVMIESINLQTKAEIDRVKKEKEQIDSVPTHFSVKISKPQPSMLIYLILF